jgi:uncharacterized protein (TIGR02217 family)
VSSFIESRINDIVGEILYETVGGPGYSTDIAVNAGGYESRNINWSQARGRWELGERVLRKSELEAIIKFIRAMKGRAFGFRFKDFADFSCTTSEGRLGTGAVGTGYPTYQMYKRYTQAGNNDDRIIKKPVAGTVQTFKGGVAQAWSVDTTTGIVTATATITRSITAITKANPGNVTIAAHGFSNGSLIYISSVGGMTQVNNLVFTIAVVDADNFTIGVNTTNYSTYTSGGTAALYPQPADVLTWSGQFDLATRFDSDQIRTRFEAYDTASGESLHFLFSLPIIEVRLP